MWQYNETNYLSHARSHKYIARVKVNGKYRYFYSQAEYAAYLKNNRDKADKELEEYNKHLDFINRLSEYPENNKMSDTDNMSVVWDAKTHADRADYYLNNKGEQIENNNTESKVKTSISNAATTVSSIASSTIKKGSDYVNKTAYNILKQPWSAFVNWLFD